MSINFCATPLQIYIFATMLHVLKEKRNYFFSGQTDYLGIGTSLICALHCIVLPLFASTMPVLGTNIIENSWLEGGSILLSLIFGYASFKNLLRKNILLPPILFAIGFTFLLCNQVVDGPEKLMVSAAAVLIIAAHILKLRLKGKGISGTCSGTLTADRRTEDLDQHA